MKILDSTNMSCTKEECSSEEKRMTKCGCIFVCKAYYYEGRKEPDYYWTRIEDCKKHQEMQKYDNPNNNEMSFM